MVEQEGSGKMGDVGMAEGKVAEFTSGGDGDDSTNTRTGRQLHPGVAEQQCKGAQGPKGGKQGQQAEVATQNRVSATVGQVGGGDPGRGMCHPHTVGCTNTT